MRKPAKLVKALPATSGEKGFKVGTKIEVGSAVYKVGNSTYVDAWDMNQYYIGWISADTFELVEVN